jgi:glycosyltransferase involved in cell wall biosynthesis
VEFIFWQNILTLHQSAFLRALAERGHRVMIVAESELQIHRRAMGWTVPDFGKASVVLEPDHSKVLEILLSAPSNCIHVVGGFRGFRLGATALQHCTGHGMRVGLLTEGADPRGVEGMLRRFVYSYQLAHWKKSLAFIAAMGTNGVKWFEKCGFPEDRILPFIYVTEKHVQREPAQPQGPSVVEFVYLGQCVKRKGVDLVINALAPLREMDWRFTVVGDGPEKAIWQQLAEKLGLDRRVLFENVRSNKDALAIVDKMDFLILPSRFDGWGAVVNEALMLWVPVICSVQCGASDIVQQSTN